MGESSFTFRTGPRETLEVSRIVRGHLFPMQVQLAVFAASILPVLVGVAAGYAVTIATNSPANASVFILGGVILGFLVARPFSKAANRWSMERLGGAAAAEDFEIAISFREDGVHFRTASVTAHSLWSGIDRIIDSHGSIYVVTGVAIQFVPARCFASDEERRAVLAFARERLSEQARQRSNV